MEKNHRNGPIKNVTISMGWKKYVITTLGCVQMSEENLGVDNALLAIYEKINNMENKD